LALKGVAVDFEGDFILHVAQIITTTKILSYDTPRELKNKHNKHHRARRRRREPYKIVVVAVVIIAFGHCPQPPP
jgi:hypothetical protein